MLDATGWYCWLTHAVGIMWYHDRTLTTLQVVSPMDPSDD